ncbi:hypothetical protein MHU86_13188 [Fragilaria crotonensis]|nr:hypothetical protein MHU86_13188 [Fragilaria crotonensis]
MPSSPLTRFLQTVSSIHSMRMSVRAGKTTTAQAVGEVLFSREHFPKFLTATMALSGLTGYFTMDYIQRTKWEAREALHDRVWEEHQRIKSMSTNESMVVAMVENAKNSSWRENLDNAFEAQEHFMLGSADRQEPKFLTSIRERRDMMAKKPEESYRWTTGE